MTHTQYENYFRFLVYGYQYLFLCYIHSVEQSAPNDIICEKPHLHKNEILKIL